MEQNPFEPIIYTDPSVPVGEAPAAGWTWAPHTVGSQNNEVWGWQAPYDPNGSSGGWLGGLFSPITQGIQSTQQNLGSSISDALSDPNFAKFALGATAMYGGAGGFDGLFSGSATPATSMTGDAYLPGALGSGQTGMLGTMTPAQIEAMTNAAGYGTTALGGGANAYPWSSLFSNLGSGISGLADSVGTGLSGFGSSLSSGLGNFGNGLFSGLGNFGSSLGSGLASGFGNLGSSLGSGLASGMGSIGSALNGMNQSQMWSAGLNALAGQAQADAARQAAQTQADAQIRAAQIAADAAKFKPVGVTTGFGSSQFGYDANGNLTSAGYNLSPEMKAQRDALIAQSGGLLNQFQQSQAATAPMSDAAQRAMTLGNQYLATDPQAQAQKYYQDQMKLLEPGRADDLAQLQAQMQAQGRGGFAIGGGVGGMGAANPQLQALYNAQLQQNNQLAVNATQGGMDYAKFGAGLVGTGGDLLSGMYNTQVNAFNPYKTALGGAQTVEGLGQNALTQGISLGGTTSSANANAGNLLASGMTSAANTMAPANAYSPWANLLGQGATALSSYKYDPMTGKAL